MLPCFGFRRKIMLIIHLCFSCCWAVLTLSQGLFSFSCCPASEDSGGAQGAGRGQNQDSWPSVQRNVPYHAASCWGIKPGGICQWQGVVAAQEHWSASGEQLHCASLDLFYVFYIVIRCEEMRKQVMWITLFNCWQVIQVTCDWGQDGMWGTPE